MKIKELFEEQYSEEYKRTQELIKSWLNTPNSKLSSLDKGILNYHITINSDGSINASGDRLFIIDEMLDNNGEYPIRIKRANKIVIAAGNLTSFKNFPTEMEYGFRNKVYIFKLIEFKYDTMSKLTSFEYFPSKLNGSIQIGSRAPNLSFAKIDNYIKEMNGIIFISPTYSGPLLSFLKIKGEPVLMSFGEDVNKDSKIVKALGIINNHLSITGNRDILGCQDELIDNGLSEYAKL
jgi:hypothetical protein